MTKSHKKPKTNGEVKAKVAESVQPRTRIALPRARTNENNSYVEDMIEEEIDD